MPRYNFAKYLDHARSISDFSAEKRFEQDYHNVFERSRDDLLGLMGPSALSNASILVLGCGYSYPDVILYSTCAQRVVGIDVIQAFYRDGILKSLLDLHKRGGMLASMLKVALNRHGMSKYYELVAKVTGQNFITHAKYDLISYDGIHMPFGKDAFDVVISNAVLEHVENLDQLFAEVHRVTKPSGISYHVWHNFYSLSGGHAPEPMQRRHPWGHLRGKYDIRFLNKAKPASILSTFGKYFEHIDLYSLDKGHRKKGSENYEPEGEALLTGELREELVEHYPVDLLLTRAFLVVGRNRPEPQDR